MKHLTQEVNNYYKKGTSIIKKLDAEIIRRRGKLHKDRQKLDEVELMREKIQELKKEPVKIERSE